MKVGSRMFRKVLETEVFKKEDGGLMTNTTSEQLGWSGVAWRGVACLR